MNSFYVLIGIFLLIWLIVFFGVWVLHSEGYKIGGKQKWN